MGRAALQILDYREVHMVAEREEDMDKDMVR